MSETKKSVTTREDAIYKCPMCFFTLNDVIILPYKDGKYRCIKCGYNDTHEGLLHQYASFRSRYKAVNKRYTLEEQRNM